MRCACRAHAHVSERAAVAGGQGTALGLGLGLLARLGRGLLGRPADCAGWAKALAGQAGPWSNGRRGWLGLLLLWAKVR